MTAPSGSANQYSAPRYYEIAFDMNRRQEVNFLVHCFRRYARRRVHSVLDIACGTGPHPIPLAERGYAMGGPHPSPQNIEFLPRPAPGKGRAPDLLVAAMTPFNLRPPRHPPTSLHASQ